MSAFNIKNIELIIEMFNDESGECESVSVRQVAGKLSQMETCRRRSEWSDSTYFTYVVHCY